MSQQAPPPAPSGGRPRALIFSLMLVVITAAFALGAGVTGLLDEDEIIVASRPARASTATIAVTEPPPVVTVNRDSRFGLLDEVYEILNEDFVEPEAVDLQRLRTGAINGAVGSLNDPHSVYLDEETFRMTSEDISGSFEGIGATVQQEGEEIVITGTFRGSPAEAAGIRAGDVILFVDGESTAGWSLQFAVSVIRGERGTPVELVVRHRNDEEETITVIRDRIIIPSVQSFQITDRGGRPGHGHRLRPHLAVHAQHAGRADPAPGGDPRRRPDADHHRPARQPGRPALGDGRHDRHLHGRRPGADRGRPRRAARTTSSPTTAAQASTWRSCCWSTAAPPRAPR